MSKKKNIKGMREKRKEVVEKNAGPLERQGAPGIVPVDLDTWWHIFEGLEVDGKLDLLYNTMETVKKDEFWEGLYVFEAVDNVFNSLASTGRVEEGILLLERLKEVRPVQYMDKSKFYDYYLLHYYAPQGDKARMQEIIEHFECDLEDGIDYITVALNIFRLYGMTEEISRLSRVAYKELKDSDSIMPWGVEDLNQRAIFCVILEYITSPGYGEDEAEKKFLIDLKELDFWEEDEEETIDDELPQKTVKTLTGELRRNWKREDFMNSNKDCDANVYFIATEFSRYLHQEKSFEWVTGDLFSEVVVEYFSTVSRGKRGFYFTFSQEWLDEFIGSYFDILSLNDARGMAVLKAVEYFTVFLHQKGIYRDKELKKVEPCDRGV